MKRLLFFMFIAALAVPNAVLFFTEPQPVAVRLCNVVLPTALYWLAMSASRKVGCMIWIMFPFIFLAAFEIVLLFLFGQSVIGVDMFLNVVTTNPDEAFELLGRVSIAVICVVLLYVPFLVAGVIYIKRCVLLDRAFLLRQRRMAAVAVLAAVTFTGICRISIGAFRINSDIFPLNSCCNLVLAVERGIMTARYEKTSADFTYNAIGTHDADRQEVYVLVIGETARAANFGIYGYYRSTTPLLEREEGLTVFQDALTQSNTTHKSVSLLLSPASAENYSCIYRTRGIITAFNETGFHTAFFSNQRRNHSFIDKMGGEADRCVFVRDSVADGEAQSDMVLLKAVADELEKGYRKNFIVLHTYGSHFSYDGRYGRDEAFFLPDDDMTATAGNKQKLMNAYDNSIRQTDRLLHGLIEMLRKTDAMTALVYTSDHGEDIFDDSRNNFLHASPVPTYWQLHVPLLVWTSDGYGSEYGAKVRALHDNSKRPVATSASVFHTLLDMAGIETEWRDTSLSVASSAYKPRQRHYLN
ncbi:MAG: sulfatase-like hydrolase/transferase, partial [Prevotella sp.]